MAEAAITIPWVFPPTTPGRTSPQIQWLQEIGKFAKAATVAQEMQAQVKRDINEQHMQSGANIGKNSHIAPLVLDAEVKAPDLDRAYEAAVWAKVTLAGLAIEKIGGGERAVNGHDHSKIEGTETTRKASKGGGEGDGVSSGKVCWCTL